MEHIKVKIINESGNELPTYETHSAAGMDVRARLDAPVTLKPSSACSYPPDCACSCLRAMSVRCAPARVWP